MNIVGNIKKKVSYLIVSSCTVTFTQNDLDINSFFLYGGEIANESKKIRTNFFIFDSETYNLNYDKMQNTDIVKVNQLSYGAYCQYESDSGRIYRIVYSNSSFLIQNENHKTIISIP